jgi:hypothetical protein
MVFKAPGLFSVTCRKVEISTKNKGLQVDVEGECLVSRTLPLVYKPTSISVPNMSFKLGTFVCQ